MPKQVFFLRYQLIIQKLKKSVSTFKEISDYLDRQSDLQDYDLRISTRTFQRDIAEIRSIFNTDIQYDFRRKCYFIAEESKSDSNARMLEAFEMFNALNLTEELTQHIHFEKRKPQGSEHFYGILHAIKNNLAIKVTYFKYEADKIVNRLLEPLLLKEFKGRWYVLARDTDDGYMKTYGLDRIQELEITQTKFAKAEGQSLSNFFQDCFGITKPSGDKPETIILAFDALQGKYIKSFPLHESQRIIIDNEEETHIQLSLFITYDFVLELLSYGERVKVIQPKSLIQELQRSYRAALDKY